MNLIFLDPSDEFLTQVVNIGIPKHNLGFCFHVSKRGYKIGCELTRFLSRLAEPEEFQIGQVKIDDERVSDELLMSSNLWSKKVDLQKAFEIIVSENAGHLEACDSIRCTWNNLLAKLKANVLADLKQESW